MVNDITKILEGWDYEPDEVSVRIVEGDDGQEKVQLRIDLGLLQMEISGRPDGQRPKGCCSWLDYYEQKRNEHNATNPDGVPFELGDEDCGRLWREGVQFYHRYLSLWHLRRYDLCERDTARNLRLFAFVRANAREDRNKLHFDQWRPYVTMMHTRAIATPLHRDDRNEEALAAIERGIGAIRDFLEEYGHADEAEDCDELTSLVQWREKLLLEKKTAAAGEPGEVIDILRGKLKAAVTSEQFEEAARLRDEIRRLSG
jgi:hypothetical protein